MLAEFRCVGSNDTCPMHCNAKWVANGTVFNFCRQKFLHPCVAIRMVTAIVIALRFTVDRMPTPSLTTKREPKESMGGYPPGLP